MPLSTPVGACLGRRGRGKNESTRAGDDYLFTYVRPSYGAKGGEILDGGGGVGILRLFMYWDTQKEPLRR